MMNYQEIFRQALNQIKSKWDLPSTGFLAGGSLSNVVWNIITGKNAPVNDLDVYHLTSLKKDFSDTEIRKKQNFIQHQKVVFEDYTGLNVGFQRKGYYAIEKVSIDGIMNNIEYSSSTEDRNIIIESFDINCCQLGYDIDKDEFVWTKDFEKFLYTGKLQLINLSSPAHSAIRLVKKQSDLECELPELELDIICYSLKNLRFVDTKKHRFKERYAKMFQKYKFGLESKFKLVRDKDLELYLKNNLGVEDNIWTVNPKIDGLKFDRSQVPGIILSKDFLYYIRNILNKSNFEKSWFKLYPVIDNSLDSIQYFDEEVSEEDFELLSKMVNFAPNTSRNLIGLSISNQLKLIRSILERYEKDPFVGITILENYDLNNHNLDDEMEVLLMELSVRKQIVDDRRDKVYNILGIETWDKYQEGI
jgi:hypothetical protein